MINIAICDDEFNQCEKTEEMIKKYKTESYGEWCIEKFDKTKDILEYVKSKEVHAVFLDIDMPDESGINLAREILEVNEYTKILFASSHEELVFDAIKVKPLRFVRKGNLEEDMKDAMDALNKELSSAATLITFTSGKTTTDVKMKNIVSIESNAHYLIVNSVKEELKVRGKISDYLPALDESLFVQIQKGIIINMMYIESLKADKIRIKGGIEYNISRTYLDETRKAFMRYMRREQRG